jgi:hypothetical protein
MAILDFYSSFLRSAQISIPEAVMFICFGLSWPVSLIKTLRTKTVTGKSPLFLVLIIIGYMSGITHKIIFSRDILILHYLVNLSMIIADLGLYLRYSNRKQVQSTRLNKWERVLTLFLQDLNREPVIPSTQLSASPPPLQAPN